MLAMTMNTDLSLGITASATHSVSTAERMAALLLALPVGVIEHRSDGSIVDANREAERILGLSREQLLGMSSAASHWRTVHEDGEDFLSVDYPSTLALTTGQSQRDTVMGLKLPDGRQRWLQINAEPLMSEEGEVAGALVCFLDTTEASEHRRLLELTVDAAGLGTWEWQIESGGLRFNDRWHAMLGYAPGELTPRTSTWGDLVHPADLTVAMQALESYFEDRSQPYRCEFRVQAGDGRWIWVLAAGAVIEQDNDGRPRRMAGVHLDITQRKQLEQALSDAAMTDALTQLPNRHALCDRLQRCRDRSIAHAGSCYAVLFMDFDRFKLVNDSLGHDAGDELLRQIATRMQAALRPGDEIARLVDGEPTAVRIGGDEFVVLVDRLRRPSDAERVAQRLLDVLRQPYDIAGQEVLSTASIGIVTSDRADRDPDALLRDADTAMYEAKSRGRGRYVVFSEDMHDRVRDAVRLEADLRRALNNGQELHVLYQPIVELDTQRMVGVEALVRWTHPTRGEIAPNDFIPLAEESGLIVELGNFVLRTACWDAMTWRSSLGLRAPATVSVNLSRAQIVRSALAQQVADQLRESGLPAHALRLEITETFAMQDSDLIYTLEALRALGVSLALDDFGTGYSSLSSLDQLPLDVVKIDRSFTSKMAGSEYHAALIEATLRMAKALHLEVVAEGVETKAQADQLLLLGCPLAQGWLFGRPMPALALIERGMVAGAEAREGWCVSA
ncbi:MAG: two-component system response regulator [Burkholderiales bacterium PBB1]|nr:MAG: two-component system response regulator [Burkholderiales bacterium PBB1]